MATIRVHVQPRSAKNRCCGMHGDALKVAVPAPPVEGRANSAVGDYLAELLGVSARSVVLLAGAQSRQKLFSLESLTVEEAQTRLDRLLAEVD